MNNLPVNWSPENELFRSIPHGKFHLREFAASLGLHLVLLGVLVCVPLLAIPQPQLYQIAFIIPRLSVAPKAPPLPMPAPLARTATARLFPPPANAVQPPKSLKQPPTAKLEDAAKERVIDHQERLVAPMPPASGTPPITASSPPPVRFLPQPAKPSVRTDVFSSIQTAATVNRPARQVQTGGLGNPYELPLDPESTGAKVAQVGSFDLPPGSGQGNGRGGEWGIQGTVASAGFGSAMAADEHSRSSRTSTSIKGGVESSGFRDLNQAPDPHHAGTSLSAKPVDPETLPVEIIFKPKPAYTEEARGLKLEGDVLLEVTFTATGEVRVLGLVRRLGHGLDEAAIRAAEQIRFKPAQRRGKLVDFRSTVVIVFRLA